MYPDFLDSLYNTDQTVHLPMASVWHSSLAHQVIIRLLHVTMLPSPVSEKSQ